MNVQTLIIGGGQAGLAMGGHLQRAGVRFAVLDAHPRVGDAWRRRWDSLTLFTPARYDNLPGLPFPAGAETYPGKDHAAGYLQAYAAEFELPVRLGTTVTSLTRGADDEYVAKAGAEELEARQVVVATGPFQVPFIPPVAAGLTPEVHQIHSADYRRPDTLPPGRVLVVGGANSGCQIAVELSGKRTVELSVGKRIPTVPQRPLGRDVWWWASGLRLDRVTADSRLGRRLAGRDQVVGEGPRRLARRHGVTIRPRVVGATGRSVAFADGTRADYDLVVWATGYTVDDSWIDIPDSTDARGRLTQSRGITPSPGLYTLGRTWQHTRGSALLGWVDDDAAYVAEKIASRTG
jgi:putative flavoprotein involved in K+ transport